MSLALIELLYGWSRDRDKLGTRYILVYLSESGYSECVLVPLEIRTHPRYPVRTMEMGQIRRLEPIHIPGCECKNRKKPTGQ